MKTASTLLLATLLLPQFASAAFPTVVTRAELENKYLLAGQGGEKVKVLLMPGHEPTYGGAELNGLRERDVAVDIANKIARELSVDTRLEVAVARDQLAWNDTLTDYFEEEWDDIEDFVSGKKRIFNRAIRKGDIAARDFEPAHNTAATDVALRLYGITKWANEEGYDVAVHLHLNDTGAQNHQGFAVYVPDKEFGNAEASRPLGEAIAYELNRYHASSTLPIENYGVVEDQSLIALGAYNTADFPSVLIEYAYIYEPKIKNPEARDAVLSDMAHQTYRGIEKYLGATVVGSDTLALPYAWTGTIQAGESSEEAHALQIALKKLGFFPPQGQLLLGCPFSGVMDTCTTDALTAFQKSKGWTPTGAIGPMTKAAFKAAGY
jgi:N-acetylmuramoyl-L-alanine amidase